MPFSFWRKITFVIVFFTLAPLTLLFSIISLSLIKNNDFGENINQKRPSAMVYASIPQEAPFITTSIVSSDARKAIVEKFLSNLNSPIANLAGYIVQTSDNYGIDWRLIPAIAAKESGACRAIPEESYNCWGWGIHSKGTLRFSSFEEAIDAVSKGLKENYIDKGLVTPEQIMSRYAHPDSTTWADDVKAYIDKLK